MTCLNSCTVTFSSTNILFISRFIQVYCDCSKSAFYQRRSVYNFAPPVIIGGRCCKFTIDTLSRKSDSVTFDGTTRFIQLKIPSKRSCSYLNKFFSLSLSLSLSLSSLSQFFDISKTPPLS